MIVLKNFEPVDLQVFGYLFHVEIIYCVPFKTDENLKTLEVGPFKETLV